MLFRSMLYLGLVALLTFHEFAHAWTAWRCGDDTARLQGRLTINPIAPSSECAHMKMTVFSKRGSGMPGIAIRSLPRRNPLLSGF